MRVAKKFTPEVLIEAPRRGPAVPSPDGTKAFYTLSTHTVGGDTLKEVKILDVETGASQVLSDSSRVHDVAWLTADSVAYLESGDDGTTELKVADVEWSRMTSSPGLASRSVAKFAGPVKCLRLRALGDGSFALAVVGRVGSDGKLFNETREDGKSSIRVYDDSNVRFWDTYLKPQKYTIWYSRLVKSPQAGVPKHDSTSWAAGEWKLESSLRNLLPDNPELEAPSGVNDSSSNAASSYDLSEQGIVFAAQDPSVKEPLYKGTTKIYFVHVPSWADDARPAAPREVPTYRDTSRGVHSNPRFSPDGKMVAFLKRSVERSQDNKLFVAEVGNPSQPGVLGAVSAATDVFAMVTGQKWDLVPSGFEFAEDGHSLLLTAFDHGLVTLHRLKLQPDSVPELVFKNGSVSAFAPLVKGDSDRLLVSSSTFVESSLYQIVDVPSGRLMQTVSSLTQNGAKLGLSPEQVSEMYFQGAGEYFVQAWVVRPRDFDETKKYPLCLHVHGGPESSWNNQWSTRWNAAVWAEQGYIVVAPNITGSVGFGLDHTERIYGQWGGLPYEDLEKCLDHLEAMPNLDLDNAVAAGASYGGYMMLWMQGHSLARKFKAIVCHDGVFHLPSFILECDMEFGREDFHGPPYLWRNPAELDRWNPARPDLLRRWRTPMLVVHSDRDFRVPVTEGLAAFKTCLALGVESRLVNFPDENHFVLREENSLRWHREVFAWVNRFSGVAARGQLDGAGGV